MSDLKSLFRNLVPGKKTAEDLSTAEGEPTFLIVGLGNPGREYRETRHNVGFMVVDRLAVEMDIKLTRVQHKAIVGSGMYDQKKVILAKPQTYMNLSGESVSGLVRFYKVPLSQIMVIHDDLDLPFGTLRIRPSGGSAGQRGMESIINRLGSQDFPRLRVGIGRPAGSKQGASYVLRLFSPAERKELDFILQRAVSAVQTFIREDLNTAMNRYNGGLGEMKA